MFHHSDVRMSLMVSQITGVPIVCSTVCSGANQRRHQSSVSLAFVRGIHRRPVNSPHKGLVMRNVFPFDDVIMSTHKLPPQITLLKCWIYMNILSYSLARLSWGQLSPLYQDSHIPLPNGPGQVKLPVGQVDLGKVFFLIIYDLYGKMRNSGSWASENLLIHQALYIHIAPLWGGVPRMKLSKLGVN